ncbi:MAG: DUF4321 domain-containing protein [Vallitalea sp.]|nr:DUF4321 domain-containing protein [Vallitalea sp.]
MNYRKSNKNGWALFLLILAGIVLGGFIGSLVENVKYVGDFLNFGYPFGMENPLDLNLQVLEIMLKVNFHITIASVIGIIAGILVYRKI